MNNLALLASFLKDATIDKMINLEVEQSFDLFKKETCSKLNSLKINATDHQVTIPASNNTVLVPANLLGTELSYPVILQSFKSKFAARLRQGSEGTLDLVSLVPMQENSQDVLLVVFKTL